MKHLLTTLFVLISSFGFSQTTVKPYDYFVQYNGDALSKKANFDQIINHPFLTELKKDSLDFSLKELSTLVKLDQVATIMGSFTDSISYYQTSIPIKSRENIKQFLIKKQKEKQIADSFAQFEIQDFPNYSMLTSSDQKFSMAWNDAYLVILEFTKKQNDFDGEKTVYDANAVMVDTAAVAVPANSSYGDPVIESAPVEEVVDAAATPANVEASGDTVVANDLYYEELEKRRIAFDSIQKIKQIDFLKSLFDKGYVMPTSTKVNPQADISSWVDYGGILAHFTSSFSSLTRMAPYGKYFPSHGFGRFIKGMNFDFYFDNDNARIEEIVEYSKPVADIFSEINDRKINKRIFNYFPNKEPLAYLSYHFDAEKTLEKTPQLASEVMANTVFSNEDFSLVTDLISTIIDEKATATLFDGDLSMFLYDVQKKQVKTKVTEYNDNFEATTVDKMVEKTVPLFAAVFTSTHPTFGDKLIQLGLRKKLLIQKENYYEIVGDSVYGKFFILKDKDVMVISNSYENLNGTKSEFVSKIKKELKSNYFVSNLNIKNAVDAYSKIEKGSSKNSASFIKAASKFKNLVVLSPKKITNNKLTVEIRLNTEQTNKNVMLQTLDLLQELKNQ